MGLLSILKHKSQFLLLNLFLLVPFLWRPLTNTPHPDAIGSRLLVAVWKEDLKKPL